MGMTESEMNYLGQPDIPAGMTCAEYRRRTARPRTGRRLARIFKRR
jgi:hypothetical protein